MQRNLKAQATTLAIELGQLRTLLVAESISSILEPLLIVVACWLVVIFLSFSLIAPRNATATFSLMVSAASAATAIFLVLELDRPFSGVLRIPNEPMVNVLNQLSTSGP
jgi:zinc transporter ZupT